MKNTRCIKEWFGAFLNLLFPRCCAVCGKPLVKGEECICILCNINLPRTNFHLRKENPVERLFWGKIPLGRATSFFFYKKENNYRQIVFQLKYRGHKETGEIMGRYMATEMLASGFFQGIDALIPVPLHAKKMKLRGYNQSEWLAKGVAAVTGIPIVTDAIVRLKNTETQTRKLKWERWENMEGVFELGCAESLWGKHVLLIDDVLTTGATTVACGVCLAEVEGVKISVLTLAAAHW